MPAENTNFFSLSADSSPSMHRHASSRGNQAKYVKDGFFYKADLLGYEGLSEVLASRLALYTTLTQYGVVRYYPCWIEKDKIAGCCSKIFVANGQQELTLYIILTRYYNTDLKGVYKVYEDSCDIVTFTFFDFVREFIICEYSYDILPWMTQLLKFDYLILNEDRHFRNISFLVGDSFKPTPLFDNGAAFLSDMQTYPLSLAVSDCISQVEAKPFCFSFEAQMKLIEKYHLPQLEFTSDRIDLRVSDLAEFYSEEKIGRAVSVLQYQLSLLYPQMRMRFV